MSFATQSNKCQNQMYVASLRPFGGRYKHTRLLCVILLLVCQPTSASHYLVYEKTQSSKTFMVGRGIGEVRLDISTEDSISMGFKRDNRKISILIPEPDLKSKLDLHSGLVAHASEDDGSLYLIFDWVTIYKFTQANCADNLSGLV